MKSDTELAAELRRLADPMGWGKGFPELPTFAEAADRLEALVAERDAAVARVAELEAACRRCEEASDAYLAYYFGMPGAEEILKELAAACRAAALLAGEGGGR